jgi:naphtho-gamma-pyrone polyketide synthase
MGESCHIYLFGDQTFEYSKELRDIVHLNSDPLVISFFEETYNALRVEIGSLPKSQRQEFESFSNFSELAAQKLAGSLHPSLDQALSCAYELASFIR